MNLTRDQLLQTLRERDVRLWVEGGQLCCNAPKGALTPELRSQLASCKAELLAFLQTAQRTTDHRHEAPLRRFPRQGSAPVSFAQRRLWFLDQLEPASPKYNLPFRYRLSGRPNVPALERALHRIIERHEALRTTFDISNGEPVQIIHPALSVSLAVHDLSHLPRPERDPESHRLEREDALRPFDLAQGPLLRTALLRLAEAEHLLLITMHHSVGDLFSTGVLVRELAALYEAFAAGKADPLPELPIQYADFAMWQRERLQGEARQQQLRYWTEQLREAPPLRLPTDRPHSTSWTSRGAAEPLWIPAPVVEGLQRLAARENATLFMTLLAGFNLLLHRHTGQEDIVLGCPVANRTRPEMAGLIGFFVNSLVLRCRLNARQSFRDLTRLARDVVLGALAHQDVPFEMLVETLQPDRAHGQNPFFQVVLTLQNWPALELRGLQLTPVSIDVVTTRFDLEVYLNEPSDGLRGTVVYSTDLFERETIQRMVSQLGVLLESVAADPDQPLSQVPLLTGAERHHLLTAWQGPAAPYPKDQSIHQLFDAQAAARPEAIALTWNGQRMTYRELNQRANQLAWRLKKLGVGPDVLVGVCLDRSFEMVVAVLGILKAGGAYVPLDPAYPTERLRFMIGDTQARVVLTQTSIRSRLPLEETPVICLDEPREALEGERTENPAWEGSARNLAYVMYTSGSTGKPKGVAIPHRGVLRLLLGVDYVTLGSDTTCLQHSPVSFDAATLELWGPLLHGGRCVLYPGSVPDLEELGRIIRAEGVTMLWLTSALFNWVIDEAPDALLPVRELLVGGEALSVTHVRRALERLPGTRLINGYGPTESTTFTCCYDIPKSLPDQATSIPLGQPIANTQVYVLDAWMNPVPVGIVGELYIGGDGLARGYWNRPDLTAERFVAAPWEAGARLYKTGDLVRYRTDGTLEFLGRNDTQVKVRGYRIELGEIETVLRRQAGVKECVVAARETAPSEKQLVAYVVAGLESKPSAIELKRRLEAQLPGYMVPGAFVFLERLPLTPNGKVDRGALPAPDQGRRETEGRLVAPRTPLETTVAGIMREVLGLEEVGVHDNFFELGGHSLLATQMMSRLRSACQVEVPLRSLFNAPTVAGIAEAIEQLRAEPVLGPAGRTGTLGPSSSSEAAVDLDLEKLKDDELDDVLNKLLTKGTPGR